MTNEEKYKTAEERRKAYDEYCKKIKKEDFVLQNVLGWLEMDYVPPPETIPDIVADIRKLADRIEAAWNRRIK